jgi:carbon-monoxide dehydrogenase small subunit/xanthine dehydrogenase small subunit
MNVLTPTTLDDALAMMSADAALRPIAGGTDLLVDWHHHDKREWKLLDLSRLDGELHAMRLTDDALEIGALTTYWDVMRDKQVASAFPLLAEAARQVGAVQIQTRGTWAGNIANGSPAADGVPVTMAYDATVVLQSAQRRREVALHEYYTGYKQTLKRPDELIVAIRLPRRPRKHEWFHKVGARNAQAITKVGVAVVVNVAAADDHGWRVVANSVAPTVCRCRNLESLLASGTKFDSPGQVRDALAGDIAPIDDIRSTGEYRATVLANLLFHWLQESRA